MAWVHNLAVDGWPNYSGYLRHCGSVGRDGAESQLRGKTLPLADGLIAATALEHDLTLVTRNTKDFSDLGVDILNPWQGAFPASRP